MYLYPPAKLSAILLFHADFIGSHTAIQNQFNGLTAGARLLVRLAISLDDSMLGGLEQ